jgi:hypothetical protein
MTLEKYRLTSTDPKRVFNLTWDAKTLTIRNYTKMVVYVNVGSSDYAHKLAFTDFVAPFHMGVIDPAESRSFSIAVDTSSDPLYTFPLPITIIFSSGGSSVQSMLQLGL